MDNKLLKKIFLISLMQFKILKYYSFFGRTKILTLSGYIYLFCAGTHNCLRRGECLGHKTATSNTSTVGASLKGCTNQRNDCLLGVRAHIITFLNVLNLPKLGFFIYYLCFMI